eukprot:CAMPEP_0115010916 /NCGR_PEP_ID=MMETSP0216-20121206/23637_1 /TAXON_ID=223996 /ORGANISM="Protocruzia adherens, Strain Boccale" /LENGTH=484 /DNA_ID=CAMNT_0002379295 /DNA_START=60 /DNA_END=1514 /DNA_ORIENTATION=-
MNPNLKLLLVITLLLLTTSPVLSKKKKKHDEEEEHDHKASEIEVAAPTDFSNPKIDSEPALFGRLPYDTSVTAEVLYEDGKNACSPNTTPVPSSEMTHSSQVVVVYRTYDCNSVTQAKNVQGKGGKMLLVINMPNFGDDLKDWPLYDDGSGGEVKIPVLLISNTVGDEIVTKVTDEDKTIFLKVGFNSYHPNNSVQWEVWTTSSDVDTYTMLNRFHDENKKLAEFATMTPHYLTFNCDMWCEEEFVEDHCLCGGKYCFYDAASSFDIKGKEIMAENLRQICLYDYAHDNKKENEDDDPDVFWDYLEAFHKECLSAKEFGQQCSERIMKKEEINIDVQAIEDCVAESQIKDGKDNALLKKEAHRQKKFSISHYPYVLINERPMYGEHSTENILYTICSDLKNPEKSEECKNMKTIANLERHVDENISKEGIAAWVIVLILVFIVATFGFIFVLYRRHVHQSMNKDVNRQVNTAVSQYFALADERK